MTKYLTYFWVIIISISIEIPSYINIFDFDYETSIIFDLEEELEDSENIENTEVKFTSNFNTFFNYVYPENKTEFIFIDKKYNSIYQNLESPPPDQQA